MNRIYVDTDVFLNTWFREMLKLNPAFYRTERLLEKVVECTYYLVISNLTLKELSKKMSLSTNDIKAFYFEKYEQMGKLSVVKVTQPMIDQARGVPTHLTDAVHAVVAKQENAILVTRNIKDFRRAAKKLGLRVARPEELT
jgi:predicted nucleic acid-binding protein